MALTQPCTGNDGGSLDVERVYREHGDRLWRSVLLYAGDREVASDSVAEAFAQLLRRGGEVRDPAAWVWRAAFRIAAGELGRRRRFDPPHDTSYEVGEASLLLHAVMLTLSPKQRAAVVLHHYAGYSLREVAGMVGSTASAVGVHLHRARVKAQRVIQESRDG